MAHHLACGKYSSRIDRHNHRTALLHRHIAALHIYDGKLVKDLFSSSTSKRQIDLKLDSSFHSPLHLSIDTTISCILLPSYLPDTAVAASRPYAARAAHKISKHAAECAAAGRAFLPFVGDTLGGIGPDAFVSWLKGLFAAADLAARSDGGDHAAATFALDHLLCDLLATLVRDNHLMIERLTVRDRP